MSVTQHDCALRDGFSVTKITPLKDFVVVTGTADGGQTEESFSAKSIVICAGPWTNRLLQPLGYGYLSVL